MPCAGQHYPGICAAMRAWFPDDAACLDYLDWLRWPAGFRCPSCGCTTCWEVCGGERRCTDCRLRVSRTAGTIFQDTRTPLTVWFTAAWHLTTQKNGASAMGLKRVLGLGSYETAWAMLHRYRTAMVRPGRERLNGDIEAEVEEQSMLDGANLLQRFFYITSPMVKSGLIATGMLTFVASWNEFLYAVILTVVRAKPLTVLIAGFITDKALVWGPMAAMGCVVIVTVLVIMWLMQRDFISGVSAGALKG
jgi:hypothetical protein